MLTSFAVQLDFSSNDWSVSFTFAFISSNEFSPLVEILSEAIVVTISETSSILSMSGNALMLQIDNLSAYYQNFISFKAKKALRIAKKEKPRSLQLRLIYDSPIHTRGLITMVHCYGPCHWRHCLSLSGIRNMTNHPISKFREELINDRSRYIEKVMGNGVLLIAINACLFITFVEEEQYIPEIASPQKGGLANRYFKPKLW